MDGLPLNADIRDDDVFGVSAFRYGQLIATGGIYYGPHRQTITGERYENPAVLFVSMLDKARGYPVMMVKVTREVIRSWMQVPDIDLIAYVYPNADPRSGRFLEFLKFAPTGHVFEDDGRTEFIYQGV